MKSIPDRLRKLIYLYLLLSILFLDSCDKKNKYSQTDAFGNEFPAETYIDVALFKRDISAFTSHFRPKEFQSNRISWSPNSESFYLVNEKPEQQQPFLFAEKVAWTKGALIDNFRQSYYYLDLVWVDKKYNNQAISKHVLGIVADFIRGNFSLGKNNNSPTLLDIRTHSSILRLIAEIDDPNQLPAEFVHKFGNMPFDKVKSILTKSAYQEVLEEFYKLQKFGTAESYAVEECSKYWAIAPIIKIHEGFKDDIKKLEVFATKVHSLLADPKESLTGELFTHLQCIETIEEALGRYPNPETGEGIFDAYFRYIANNLWDYPMYGRQCAPFKGVMGRFTKTPEGENNYCKDNFKSVGDNLYLAYLLRRFGVRGDLLTDISSLLRDGQSYLEMAEIETELDKKLAIKKN